MTIALPKGRTLRPVTTLLAAAGMEGADGHDLAHALDEDSRALVRRGTFAGRVVHLLLLKPDDVPTYVEYGTADLGVCGRDVLVEREIDAYLPVDLGIGRCRLVVAGKIGPAPALARMPRIATKYPRTAARHFAERGVQVEIVNVQSSVELAPLTGLADLIVDLVETGRTLAENGLEVKEDVLAVSTLLVANRASYKLRADTAGALVRALRHGAPPST
ncbi:MAG: ATP phosphoribosyltransferase [Labilithrix sp.]|nr:ATP phosphoribosyltransferase [Labilithrix sp.]MCW5815917.1 ATP phosphoribosyltransferase [Labilithrix sp.]